MLIHHVIWCIYVFGSPTIIFIEKVYHHPKQPLFLIWVATTSRICLWKPIGPLHIYTPAMLLFKMWWSVWSAKENSLCSQSDLLPKTNMAMEGWSSGTCLPCFICSFCWVLSTQMSHFCPHQRFSDDVAGVSPAAMEEWTQWMRKKRAVLQLCGYQFGQRTQPWFDR